ncbi:MAG TPA: dTDP-4-dehydrorhamnose 3,5-epimerase family protein, partial [Thermoanaerobaculia bacterium]|nr:dTDP-4-dehydrorhamnose 3,5-epimerase family protein [Thermoanaerobaculia bacterium]
MIFRATPLAGVFVLEPERHGDERGFFARTYDSEELRAHGLDATIAQGSVS